METLARVEEGQAHRSQGHRQSDAEGQHERQPEEDLVQRDGGEQQHHRRRTRQEATGYAESEQLEAVGGDIQVLRKPFSVADLDAAVEANLFK